MKCPKCGKEYSGYFCPDCKSDSLTEDEFDKQQHENSLKESGSGWKLMGFILLSISLLSFLFLFLILGAFALGVSYPALITLTSVSVASFNGSILCLLFWFLNEIRAYLIELNDK